MYWTFGRRDEFPAGAQGWARMTDYYSLIAKAVGALDLNTEKARRRLYERARTALRSRMHGAYPPFHRSEIAAAELSLVSNSRRFLSPYEGFSQAEPAGEPKRRRPSFSRDTLGGYILPCG
jgi:hypothetical protein